MKNVKMSQRLTESGLMLAFATILSILKVVDLPYGGSITVASLLPVIILAYRYGFGWGLLSGFVFGLLQLLLGMSTLSYATSFGAAVAIIFLDYILAFMSTALGGFFNKFERCSTGLALASFTVCLIRYIFHVISGCTVWAGLSIPTQDALLYSLIYNATYMIPETIVTVVAALLIGSVLDFRTPVISPAGSKEHIPTSARVMSFLAAFAGIAGVTTAVVMIFSHLQNADTGEFDITGVQFINVPVLIIVVLVTLVVIAGLLLIRKSIIKNGR